jgi:integrase
VPVFSPHDLRHRRISVLHRQGLTWAEMARFVGQRKLSITADTYTHVLVASATSTTQRLWDAEMRDSREHVLRP